VGIAAEINRSQRQLEKALGHPVFYFNEAEYPCTTTTQTKSKEVNPGGFSLDADLNLFVRAAVFGGEPNYPKPHDKINYRGTTYRIDSVAILPGSGQLKLACNDANRKA